MTDIYTSLAVSLGLTLLFELAFALALGVRGRDLWLAALVNVLTNPPVVLAALCWSGGSHTRTLALELAAVLLEGYLYRTRAAHIRRPYWFSLGANAFSYGMGLVIQALR